jgi:hypothetical protein
MVLGNYLGQLPGGLSVLGFWLSFLGHIVLVILGYWLSFVISPWFACCGALIAGTGSLVLACHFSSPQYKTCTLHQLRSIMDYKCSTSSTKTLLYNIQHTHNMQHVLKRLPRDQMICRLSY